MNGVEKAISIILPDNMVEFFKRLFRRARSILTVYLSGNNAKNMKVVAVTGTNGKTTTASFTNQILKNLGYKTAIYTTVFYEIDGSYYPNKTHMTISSARVIQKFFKKAKKAGVDWVILEVTSHALDQYRIYGVPIEIAMLTNLTQDHLDYHGTMEKYADTKGRLLTDYGAKYVILNSDDNWFEFFSNKAKGKVYSVGVKSADLLISNIKLDSVGSSYDFQFDNHKHHVKTSAIGEFNIYNMSFAILAASFTGKSIDEAIEAAERTTSVAGRLERVEAGQDFTVMVDYAHTPDAIKNVLQAGRAITNRKVRLVFGATGDRDKAKRIPMGKIASQYADVIYLTDDETYTEDANKIRETVLKGIKEGNANREVKVIADRQDAIRQAFMDSNSGDVVILAGIGHEDYRNMGGKKMPWNEVEISNSILKEILNKN